MDFQSMISQFGALAGFAALVAVLVNAGKQFGLVKDGTAQNWVAGLNLAGLAALISLRVFMPEVDISALDSQAAQIAVLLAVVAAYLGEMGLSKLAHNLLKGVPVIGKSFSK
jgi:hypothetical protein